VFDDGGVVAVPEPEGWTRILDDQPDAVSALARRVRATALSALPDLTERVYPGWRALGLRHPQAGLLGTIFPQPDRVVVYLEHGAALPDPDGLLEGEGQLRQTRRLVFMPGAGVPTRDQLITYLDLALEHALGAAR